MYVDSSDSEEEEASEDAAAVCAEAQGSGMAQRCEGGRTTRELAATGAARRELRRPGVALAVGGSGGG